MKLRHPALLGTVGFFGARAMRWWMKTLHFQYRPLGPNLDPNRPELSGRYIYAMWHEYLLLPVYCYARPDISVLISKHADGQLVVSICRHLGVPVVRGSTTRGGVEALRRMLRAGRAGHLAMTPDGPRGPRRRVQPGLAYLAARLGMPIVPVGFGLQRPWRMASWDSFALPRPGSRATCVTTDPISVPANADRGALDEVRLEVERSLELATTAAERWAETGSWETRIAG
jgi:lysophospholipid acyltransferase (LPLAT)-like uncharacterized protein